MALLCFVTAIASVHDTKALMLLFTPVRVLQTTSCIRIQTDENTIHIYKNGCQYK